MKKEIIQEVVFRETYPEPPRFKEISKIVTEEDFITSTWIEPYYSENNSHDGFFVIEITREREETDQELQDRKLKIEEIKENSRKNRYQQYLKLKAEFE